MSEWALYDELTVALMNQKTIYVGAGVPAAVYEGQIWVDTTTDPPLLKIYDLTNTAWQEYHAVYYETDTGAWGDPSQTPVINGTLVIQYNSTQAGTRLWMYSNSAWVFLSVAVADVIPTVDDSDEITVNSSTTEPLHSGNYYFCNLSTWNTGVETTVATRTLTVSEDDVLVIGSYQITIKANATFPDVDVTIRLYIDGVVVDTQNQTTSIALGRIYHVHGTRLCDTGSRIVHVTAEHDDGSNWELYHSGHCLYCVAVKTA